MPYRVMPSLAFSKRGLYIPSLFLRAVSAIVKDITPAITDPLESRVGG